MSRIKRVFVSNPCSPHESQLIFTIVVVEISAIMTQACSSCMLTSAGSGKNQFEECFLSLHTVKCAEYLQHTSKLCIFPDIIL